MANIKGSIESAIAYLTDNPDEVVVEVDSESDDRGILRMADEAPVGPISMRVRVRIAGDTDATSLEQIARRGAAQCPVCDAIKRTVPVEVDVATS